MRMLVAALNESGIGHKAEVPVAVINVRCWAQSGNGAMSALSPLSGVKRKSDLRADWAA